MSTDISQNKIYVASSADNGYAIPLAAMIASVLASLDPAYAVEFFIMDGGLSPENKEKILDSFRSQKVSFHWLAPQPEKFKGIILGEQRYLSAYYKISIFNQLPKEVSRVIYLDADLIVLKNLALLWTEDINGKVLAAVQDLSIPYVDSSKALKNFERCQGLLVDPLPIPNYWEYGLNPDTSYFNSGVMLVDVVLWKNKDIETKVIECLVHNRLNAYFDQNSLNVALSRDWQALDLRWNQISTFWHYPSFACSPFDESTFSKIQNDPYIVHFVSPLKPWHFGNRHRMRMKFMEFVRMTAWKDWRPSFLGTLRIRWAFFLNHTRGIVSRRCQADKKKRIGIFFLIIGDILQFIRSHLHWFWLRRVHGWY